MTRNAGTRSLTGRGEDRSHDAMREALLAAFGKPSMLGELTYSGPSGLACLRSDTSAAVGDDTDAVTVAPVGERVKALPASTHELAEALTAISAYLTGSHMICERGDASWFDKIRGALEQAHAEAIRANKAFRELRKILSEIDQS